MASGMDDKPAPASREERLAARLRENLHRRKAQARVMRGTMAGAEKPALPKTPPKS
jgi:hypothetical protein